MDDMDEIVEEFLVESHENLDQLDRDLVELEAAPGSRALLSSVFRTLHTIKGTSGFLAFGTLEAVTHVGESLLSRLREGELSLTPEVTTILLEVVDAVRALLAEIERTGTEGTETYAALVGRLQSFLDGERDVDAVPEVPEPAASPATPAALETEQPGESGRTSLADSSVRVDVAVLDSLMNLVGELVLTRNQMLQCSASREDAELTRTTHRLNLIAGELQDGVMQTRMQTVDHAWAKLPRVVRDLSVQLGKSVDLVLEGGDTELDRSVIEAVRDPLTHLVRNCVDHGIETPEARVAAGKPARGTLTVRAFHEGGQVNLEISDDGAGIDPSRVRRTAVERGGCTASEAAALSDREAVNLVFAPGFSTAAAVTHVSGRGVGMDVVRTNIEETGGSVDLTSEPGQGTTARIRIPLTLAIIPALIVTAAGARYALSQSSLRELVRIAPHQPIEQVRGAPVHRLRGQLLPLVDLRASLGLEPAERETTYVAVLDADGCRFGLMVDEILDTEEIVVKPLGPQLHAIEVYAGATIMGDGGIALILDSVALARRAGFTTGVRPAVEEQVAVRREVRSLLVVTVGDGRRAALPVDVVDRIEEIAGERVERVGTGEVLQYGDEILPLARLDRALSASGATGHAAHLQVVVCRSAIGRVGVVVAGVLDIVEEDLAVRSELGVDGHEGSAVVQGRVTELIDVDAVVRDQLPDRMRPPGGVLRLEVAG